MTRYEFTVFLAGLTEITEEAADALFEAGCDDGSPASCDGAVWSTFHREASSLQDAISSAVADTQKAGYRVERVEVGACGDSTTSLRDSKKVYHGKRDPINREELLKRISIDPSVCSGRPCIRDTRIWVSLIIENLAEGVSERGLLNAYPQLTLEDIRAALAYAAEMTRERVIPSAVDAESA
jgi:uncharacterized protein (DUF433 family)